jgi:hypothetical protein
VLVSGISLDWRGNPLCSPLVPCDSCVVPEPTAPPTYSVEATAKRMERSRRWVDREIAANLDPSGRRSHISIGDVDVPVLRIGGRWMVAAAQLDAALAGEAVA